jgi:IS30 family transposase
MREKQEILLRYFRLGDSQRKISRDLNLNRKTVNRYISLYKSKELLLGSDFVDALTDRPIYSSSSRRKYKLTPELTAEVTRLLAINSERVLKGQRKQQYQKVDIWEHLNSSGYSVGYSTICKLVSELENKSREAFIRQRYAPGESCEFDWGEVNIDTGSGIEKYQIAVFTSGYSNYRYAYLFKSQDTSSFQQAHVNFFSKIGGVYKVLVYDNMKVAVKRFVGPTEKEATDGLLKIATYYNFSYRFCNVRRGNEKGHVERSVEFIRRKAFSVKDSFSGLKEANKYLEDVCDRLNNQPQKRLESKSYADLFREEKPHLYSCKPAFDCSDICSLKVDKYSTVTFKTCRYSVPDNLVGKMVVARIYPCKILISYDDKIVCKHKRLSGSFEWSLKIEHYTKTLQRKPGALKGSEALFQATEELQEIYQEYFYNTPRDFINLVEYISKSNISSKNLKEQITILAPKKDSVGLLDKIKILFDREKDNKKLTPPHITSEIEKMCNMQLAEQSQFLNLNQKTMEVI